MQKFLIVYATEEGQTKKISKFVNKELLSLGLKVEMFDCKAIKDLRIENEYTAVIIGASVHNGKFSDDLVAWVKANKETLEKKPAAFFSVCLGILEKKFSAQDEEYRIIISFFDEVGWYPVKSAIFAGALKYSKYNWFTKWFMKKTALKAGVETDATKDYEYTDWDAVREFTQDFAVKVMEHKVQENSFSRMISPRRLFR